MKFTKISSTKKSILFLPFRLSTENLSASAFQLNYSNANDRPAYVCLGVAGAAKCVIPLLLNFSVQNYLTFPKSAQGEQENSPTTFNWKRSS